MIKPFKPYVSIDLETTGLAHKSDILEIGAVFDDGGPIESLKTFHALIRYSEYKHAEGFAMGMNADLLKKIHELAQLDRENGTTKTLPADMALAQFVSWLQGIYSVSGKKIYFAGKNVAAFDLPMLAENVSHYLPGEAGYVLNDIMHHRTIDVGSMYFPDFGENVGLNKINKLTDRTTVSHRALDDAMDVVYAIRHKMKG